MVWSPLSNLLLYWGTTNISAAKSAGVLIALGSDWSPTGSKNLLSELKVAKTVNDVGGLGLADRELIAMATRVPASIVKWDSLVGSLEPGKRADLLIVDAPPDADVYASLIGAGETAVELVVIDGRAVFGEPALISSLGGNGETLTVGGEPRAIDYGLGDPKVPPVTCAEAHNANGGCPATAAAPPGRRGGGQRGGSALWQGRNLPGGWHSTSSCRPALRCGRDCRSPDNPPDRTLFSTGHSPPFPSSRCLRIR